MSQHSKNQGAAATDAPHPSHEDNSVSITPKDLQPGDAATHDLRERHMDSSNPEERQEEVLDDAIELSFPASDPPAITGGVTRIEKPASPARDALPADAESAEQDTTEPGTAERGTAAPHASSQ